MISTMARRSLPVLIALTGSTAVFASGFQLQNQTGSGNGNAFAGAAAVAEDAGTIFFNPAGMAALPSGHHLSVAGTVLHRSIEFADSGTAILGFTGNRGGDAGGTSVIPAGFFSYAVSPALRFGLGVTPTFGNVTEYDAGFIGRFSGSYADLKQININPALAWQASQNVALGFGLNWAHSEVEFRQAVPLGVGLETQAVLKGDDAAWGWNAGLLWQLSPATRLGLAYRSTLKFDLQGQQAVAGVPTMSFDIRSKLETPDNFSIALSHWATDKLQVLADYTWTGWSSVQSLPVIHAGSGALVNSLSYRFENSYRIGLGINYKLNSAWLLRAGVAVDKTPVSAAADRTMTLPDADRTWLSMGARWTLGDRSSLDVGYSHIFFKDVATQRQVSYPAPLTPFAHTVRGDFETSVDLLSLQYNHRF